VLVGEGWCDSLEASVRGHIRGFIEALLEEELTAALGDFSVGVVLGVRDDGQKVLLAVHGMGRESEAAWRAVLDDLVKRGMKTTGAGDRRRGAQAREGDRQSVVGSFRSAQYGAQAS
jgi:hypothetical protein